MSVALYRKYRPQNFSQISGQNHIKTTLQNEIESGRIGHAYLFCGPRGTGKTTLARLLAKAANCLDLKDRGEPCNQCDSCLEILENKSLDVIEIDAASHTGVDNVRENIINNARFTPTKRKFKIFIIDEVHMLSISAFNALLKILEEPPAHVIFILATTEAHKVPVTIISRCQRFDYKKIKMDDLLVRLKWIVDQEGVAVDEEVLKRISRFSYGCVRDAESLLEQVISLGEKKITLELAELILPRSNFQAMFEFLSHLATKNTKAAIELINDLADSGVDISQFTGDFVEFLRKCMLYKIKSDLAELSQESEEKSLAELVEILKNVSASSLAKMIDVFMKTKEEYRQSYILQLPLELAAVSLCEGGAGAEAKPPLGKNFRPDASSGTAPLPQRVIEPASPAPKPVSEPEFEPESTSTAPVVDLAATEADDKQSNNEPKESSNYEPSLTFAQVKARWQEIIKLVRKDNYGLSMSLGMGQPCKLDGNRVTLAFPFRLQQEKVEEPANKEKVCLAFKESFGKKFIIETKLDAEMKTMISDNEPAALAPQIGDNDLKDALDMFGGSVVS
ncbi:MAG TPA: DNA polymerase III subunit gamma/tau [Candidatus Bipolaricaulota bacterium]|nr:DNA polymerase III subunit gamma/tau [Candidatus Bipolaricaulota bacterium]